MLPRVQKSLPKRKLSEARRKRPSQQNNFSLRNKATSFSAQQKGSNAGLSSRQPRPLIAAANKKLRRPQKFAQPQVKPVLTGASRSTMRDRNYEDRNKNSRSQSRKRPMTAKPRGSGLAKTQKRHSNYNLGTLGPISLTPTNRMKTKHSNIRGMIVP